MGFVCKLKKKIIYFLFLKKIKLKKSNTKRERKKENTPRYNASSRSNLEGQLHRAYLKPRTEEENKKIEVVNKCKLT